LGNLKLDKALGLVEPHHNFVPVHPPEFGRLEPEVPRQLA